MKNFRNEIWSAEKDNELIPHSYHFGAINNGEKRLVKFDPFLLHNIRYAGIAIPVKFWFEVNDRNYGNWILYSGSGIVPVMPSLFFNGDAYLCFKHNDGQYHLVISLDGERIRPL